MLYLTPPCIMGWHNSSQTEIGKLLETGQVTEGVTLESTARDLGQATPPPHYPRFLLSEMITVRVKGDNPVSLVRARHSPGALLHIM